MYDDSWDKRVKRTGHRHEILLYPTPLPFFPVIRVESDRISPSRVHGWDYKETLSRSTVLRVLVLISSSHPSLFSYVKTDLYKFNVINFMTRWKHTTFNTLYNHHLSFVLFLVLGIPWTLNLFLHLYLDRWILRYFKIWIWSLFQLAS